MTDLPFIGDKTNDGAARNVRITTGAAVVLHKIIDDEVRRSTLSEYANMLRSWQTELEKICPLNPR
jgi:hypothetical protein